MLSRRLATNGTPRGTREGDPLAQARFRAETGIAYLTGIQAIARLPLDQRRLDDRASLDTAGFISGYRGSPLGSLDGELWRLSDDLNSHRIVFQPGINEDLAATAVWGSQQVGLFPGARREGVYGMWYGKAPGLDRSSDAVRHANAAGTSPRGGVLLVVGDDHACKSSTLPSASEFALRDLGVPILAPSDVQDVLDFGLMGWALSRYAGCWIGLIALTDIMDSAMTVEVDLDRHRFVNPPHEEEFPHIRLQDSPTDQEARLETKLRLARRFASANSIDRIVTTARSPRLVLVTAGKIYADVRESLARLGLESDAQVARAGVRLVKLGMTWPLDTALVNEICGGAKRLLVIEEKRPFIEDQLRTILFGRSIEVLGKGYGDHPPTGNGHTSRNLLSATGELDVPAIATAIRAVLPNGDGYPISRRNRGRSRNATRNRTTRESHAQTHVLRWLSAQHLHAPARRQSRHRGHRLSLHGAVDGSQHGHTHAHGRGGRELDRPGPIHRRIPHLRQHRRRHLFPLGHPGDPRRGCLRCEHHIQAARQRCRGHDRWPTGRRHTHRGRHGRPGPRGGGCCGSGRQRRPAATSKGRISRCGPRGSGRRATRAFGSAWLHRAGLRPDLCRRIATPPQSRPGGGPRRPRGHQRRRLRRLRRLLRTVELCRRRASRHRLWRKADH